MAKEPQELKWIESLLPDEGYRRKAMFGGFGYYLDEKLILLTFESPGERSYKGKKLNFELWNGCMFPVEHEYQSKALLQFPVLFPHPILAKWLYLPIETEGFDELVSEILVQVTRPHSFWGSIPAAKSKKSKPRKENTIDHKLDTRRPRMFSDEAPEIKMQTAKRLSDLKNFGPVMEERLQEAGIKTPQQFFKLGWQKTLLKMIKLDPKYRHSMFAYTLIAAIQNKDWFGLSDQDKKEVREFVKSLAPKKTTTKKTPKKSAKKKKSTRGKK